MILDGIDRHYAQHHDAVQHMMQHPVWGKHFSKPEDAIFPAFYLALLLGEVRTGRARAAAALGALIAFALIPVAAAGVPVIAASAAALLGLKRR